MFIYCSTINSLRLIYRYLGVTSYTVNDIKYILGLSPFFVEKNLVGLLLFQVRREKVGVMKNKDEIAVIILGREREES